MSTRSAVRVWTEDRVIPTYLPAPPDKNPMFLEKRVYQGSSGRVYPLPFTDRIAEKPVDHRWKAVWIENEFLRAMVLPELGGRIHILQDKTNGYDLIYRQEVIKPALVGLAGPWISGGIEFNWPQHHRPATFLPVDFQIEDHADGSKTIWCSDHDPMTRMKGMHGICLHPGRALLELKVRAYNRTPFPQTFLWWANVATRVHEGYQSFFPPDVHCVADHARRATSAYPLAEGFYYGVNYGERGQHGVPPSEVPANFIPPHCQTNAECGMRNAECGTWNSEPGTRNPELPAYAPNDLSWYANIPMPTSYMCLGSEEDFFGGYDWFAQAGLVHVANHHIAPGKKQWTWGNHEFGYAWDRNLTDPDAKGEHAPYIELMAGVFTDNQPDFSFLQPGETKMWSQYWYPIRKIGPAQQANLDAAVSLRRSGGLATTAVQLGVAVTRTFPRARIMLCMAAPSLRKNGGSHQTAAAAKRPFARFTRNLDPATPLVAEVTLPRGVAETELLVRVTDANGQEIIAYQPMPPVAGEVPPPATEPPAPRDIASADELFITGLHLAQYRHATRCPTLYWREALRRDPLDARCNNALGLWHLHRGEFASAETHFRNAINRFTHRNPNPSDGEPFYNLGLCLRWQLVAVPNLQSEISNLKFSAAYAAFYKATWNQAWAGAGFHALAELDCRRGDWATALEHVTRSLRSNTDNLRARDLQALVLRKLGRVHDAEALLNETLALDPLDWWARHLRGEPLTCDLQTRLDVAHDYTRAGFHAEAVSLLRAATVQRSDLPDQNLGSFPLVDYTLGWLYEKLDRAKEAAACRQTAATLPPDYCFPARVEEIAVLEAAMAANPNDARAPYYLGNLLYDRRRHEEALALWERAAKLDPKFSVVWRNLGIAYFNIRRQPTKARAAYERAHAAGPQDARLLYERDQLWKRLGESPAKRLRALEKRLDLVRARDDLSIELGALYNQTGQSEKALALLSSRRFQPWEGGEGGPLGQHVRSHLALGRAAMARGDAVKAREHFEAALTAPPHLGEARHLLANPSDVRYWLGCACEVLGDRASARRHWRDAASFQGDFQEMRVRRFSEMTYSSALSWERLGRKGRARKLLKDLLAYARELQKAPAKIDYFATSLPTMLLFEDDLQRRQETTALFLQAQAHLGLGHRASGRALLKTVLARDPSHALAADLLAGTE
ncbi:MAG: DUF5107 domain-containing protein [Verrucomicrobia bacterium]|nr:DUF5107 domain-containing protein [Verrucomicrobiota bacterium]